MSAKKAKPAGEEVVVAVDGKPTNKRFQNMFQEEIILTEKQKLRKEMIENKDKMKETLKTMTPTEIFLLFDEDDSGLISFEEFRKLLPYLDIAISDAKAFRYFRMCDSDGSGEIDIDEFQVALFACDPVRREIHHFAIDLTHLCVGVCLYRRVVTQWGSSRRRISRPWTRSKCSMRYCHLVTHVLYSLLLLILQNILQNNRTSVL